LQPPISWLYGSTRERKKLELPTTGMRALIQDGFGAGDDVFGRGVE